MKTDNTNEVTITKIMTKSDNGLSAFSTFSAASS